PGTCKTMHLLHAQLKNRGISKKWHKKPAFRVPVFACFLSRFLAEQCANNTVEAATGNSQLKNRRPRIFINHR
ncbi:hypothetical protein, partial [Streptobacillus moniliformis]|uniref:hypothetical protein n=1 Tax=Streptobacillus moniliformis TaxID=34105 RepID=UPI001E5236ED